MGRQQATGNHTTPIRLKLVPFVGRGLKTWPSGAYNTNNGITSNKCFKGCQIGENRVQMEVQKRKESLKNNKKKEGQLNWSHLA